MKRALRLAWVLVANSAIIGFTLARLWPIFTNSTVADPEVLLELALEVFFPAMGIVVELLGWKIARWTNVGYPLAAAALWLGEAIWWRRSVWFSAFLLIGLGMLALAGITHVVYQKTLSPKSIPITPEPR